MTKRAGIILGVAIALVLVSTAVVLAARPKPAAAPESASTTTAANPPTVQQLLELTNQERAAAGLAPLQLEERLNGSATAKAQDMVQYHYLQHNNPTTGKSGPKWIFETGLKCKAASENLYMGGATAEEAVSGWMNSQAHRDELLSADNDLVGFGIVSDTVGTSGGYIVVQHFCDLP